ncbi:hypothetical protein HYX11_01480 [Candidatus Woesearchaeota archaeon]|nr:hypothetical protein [Candidatus Woesearchaeota archaeon]
MHDVFSRLKLTMLCFPNFMLGRGATAPQSFSAEKLNITRLCAPYFTWWQGGEADAE